MSTRPISSMQTFKESGFVISDTEIADANAFIFQKGLEAIGRRVDKLSRALEAREQGHELILEVQLYNPTSRKHKYDKYYAYVDTPQEINEFLDNIGWEPAAAEDEWQHYARTSRVHDWLNWNLDNEDAAKPVKYTYIKEVTNV